MKLRSILITIWISFLNHLKFIVTERMFFINSIINPLGLSIVFYFIYIHHPPQTLLFGVMKAGLLGLWGANIWGASFILEGEKRLGTIDYLMVAPNSIYYVLAGKAMAAAVASNVSVLISLAWVQFFVGAVWNYLSVVWLLATLLVSTFAFSCVGILIGVFFIHFRQPEILTQIFTYPIYLLSGIAVSIEVFPQIIQYVAKLIPLYWAQQGVYEVLMNHNNIKTLIFLQVLGVCYLIGGAFVLRKVERRARWTGDFAKY